VDEAKMKERPLVRRRSGYFLLLGTIKEKPREIHSIITRPISEKSCFISPLRTRMVGFILAGQGGHAKPQPAHSMAVYFASSGRF
jgi:hypothetical protein